MTTRAMNPHGMDSSTLRDNLYVRAFLLLAALPFNWSWQQANWEAADRHPANLSQYRVASGPFARKLRRILVRVQFDQRPPRVWPVDYVGIS